MGLRQKIWARKWTIELRRLLGNKCIKCKITDDLEFDVIVPHGNNKHHKLEWSQRLTFYRREYESNNLQLLCSECNGRKKDNLQLVNLIQHPF